MLNKILAIIAKILELLKPTPVPPPEPGPPPIPPPIPPDPEKQSKWSEELIYDRLLSEDNLGLNPRVKYTGVNIDMNDGMVIRTNNGAAIYLLPEPITEGYVEFDISNVSDDHEVSRMLFLMYGAEDDDFTQNPWRVNIQKHTPESTRTKNYFRMRWLQNYGTPRAERYDEASSFNKWDPMKWYTVKVEWDKKLVRVLINGRLQFQFNKVNDYLPEEHVIEIGGRKRHESYIGAIYREVKIGIIRTGETDQPSEPTPGRELDWETLKGEEFGFRESSLKLHNTKNFWAFKSLADILLWDGERNPHKALGYDWKSYKGFSREEVKIIIQKSMAASRALDRLFEIEKVSEKFHPFTPEEGWSNYDYVGGDVVEGKLSREQYIQAIKPIIAATVKAAHLNGIAGISKGRTEGFKF